MKNSYNKQLRSSLKEMETRFKHERDICQEMLHEILRINGIALNCSEELIHSVNELNINDELKNDLLDDLFKIYLSESMLKGRLAISDFSEQNLGSLIGVHIYKKIDKAFRLLKYFANKKRIHVNLKHDEEIKFYMNAYDIFDLLPFSVLDNAIKYSPCDREVDVFFEQTNNKLVVKIDSYGPCLGKEELSHIFHRGFRGSEAVKASISGSGLGLFLVYKICEVHGITIKCESGEELFKINEVKYSRFSTTLEFRK